MTRSDVTTGCAKLAAVQALDVRIGIDASGVGLVSLRERGRYPERHSVSAFAQGLHIRHPNDAHVYDARGQFTGRLGRRKLDHAGHRVAVIDREQIGLVRKFGICDEGLTSDYRFDFGEARDRGEWGFQRKRRRSDGLGEHRRTGCHQVLWAYGKVRVLGGADSHQGKEEAAEASETHMDLRKSSFPITGSISGRPGIGGSGASSEREGVAMGWKPH